MYKEHFRVKKYMAIGKFIGASGNSKRSGKAILLFFLLFLGMIVFIIVAKRFGVM